MSRPRQEITAEDHVVLAEAAKLRESGISWPRIAAKLGKTMSWLRYRLDSTYNFYSTSDIRRGKGHELLHLTNEEIIQRRFVIDTRDFTAKLMGDPIPGDMRRAYETA